MVVFNVVVDVDGADEPPTLNSNDGAGVVVAGPIGVLVVVVVAVKPNVGNDVDDVVVAVAMLGKDDVLEAKLNDDVGAAVESVVGVG